MKLIEKVFRQAPKAIVHLRSQRERHRFGLVLGAGVSRGLGFPTWPQLVDSIAGHSSVAGKSLLARSKRQSGAASSLTRSLSTITQILFARFREREIKKYQQTPPLTLVEERQIQTRWLQLIHNHLYASLDEDALWVAIQKHPYLMKFRDIIAHSPMTVTYNFDDSVERLLYETRDPDQSSISRGYEVADRPNLQFQKDTGVVYHPNGYLPTVFEDGASPEVVFADDAFQDQLISAATGRYLHLSNHLFQNTCLLLGISLDDTTLQSLLRQNAVNNPGNIHYIVHFLEDGKSIDDDIRERIFNANFESFNLYTLFLGNKEIAALADLISMPSDNFSLDFAKYKPKYVYYVVGSVGSGKSTAASHFRNLITYDEWIDPRRPQLAVPESEVPDHIDELNVWIAEQFRKKNYALSRRPEGIHFVDRCPLDPLTFGAHSERQAKAANLVIAITDDNNRQIEQGHIILLDCDLDQVKVRNSFKHKYWEEGDYIKLLDSIGEIYGQIPEKSVVCTRGRGPKEVAREIARVIYMGDYRPVNVLEKLEAYV